LAVISSPQIGVRPFRIEPGVNLQQLRSAMGKRQFNPSSATPADGWGSVADDAFAIGLAPKYSFSVGGPLLLKAKGAQPRRLRVRYYWMHPRPRARLAPGVDPTDWRNRHRLEAADVLLYENVDGSISGLVTARETGDFQTVTRAVGTLLSTLSKSFTMTVDNVPEAIDDDLFLWLVYRLQGREQLSTELRLGGIGELSSKDRHLRPTRFSETVTMQRVELAALIALGEVKFGPAKLDLDVTNPDLGADVYVHPDGGFQPLRSSTYDGLRLNGAAQAARLIDDLWTTVLPRLRAAHSSDTTWHHTGRQTLREEARDQIRALV